MTEINQENPWLLKNAKKLLALKRNALFCRVLKWKVIEATNSPPNTITIDTAQTKVNKREDIGVTCPASYVANLSSLRNAKRSDDGDGLFCGCY